MTVRRIQTAIVGAGFAGLAMALELQRSGCDSFVVIERASGVGGTWRDNTYPGVACDVPSHLYGFADRPDPGWSGTFAPGAEIRAYLERVVDETGLVDRVLLGTPLRRAWWDGAMWCIDAGGSVIEAECLVLACGRLTEPRVPVVPGLETFPGPLFHSARWDHSVRLAGRRVAVVGTGASAVQMVPELARRGAGVTLFQRTPAWIVPRGGRRYTRDEQRWWARHPEDLGRVRGQLYAEGEARFASRSGDPDAAAAARAEALAHLEAQVPDPAMRAALTPGYAFGCKRVLLSDEFYPALASGAVMLESSALAAVDGGMLVAASGARHPADVLVLATGFEAARQPYADLVTGETGETLAAHWSTGMTSVGSTLVPGFPNLFVLNGPNASLGHNSAVLMAEAQAEFAAGLIGRGPVRVDPDAETAYTREIDRRATGTPWLTGGCRNWYADDRSGRLTLLWPGTIDDFRQQLAAVEARVVAGMPLTPRS